MILTKLKVEGVNVLLLINDPTIFATGEALGITFNFDLLCVLSLFLDNDIGFLTWIVYFLLFFFSNEYPWGKISGDYSLANLDVKSD